MQRNDSETETLLPMRGGSFDVAHSLKADGFDASEDGTGRGTPIIAIQDEVTRGNPQSEPGGKGWRDDGASFTHQAGHVQAVLAVAPVLTSNYGKQPDNSDTNAGPMLVAFQSKASSHQSMNPDAISPSLDVGKSGGVAAQSGMAVRRLTPRECERLQGFPDDYTLVPYRKKSAADGPRYKALGNSMACNVMAWIGRRIQAVEKLTNG